MTAPFLLSETPLPPLVEPMRKDPRSRFSTCPRDITNMIDNMVHRKVETWQQVQNLNKVSRLQADNTIVSVRKFKTHHYHTSYFSHKSVNRTKRSPGQAFELLPADQVAPCTSYDLSVGQLELAPNRWGKFTFTFPCVSPNAHEKRTQDPGFNQTDYYVTSDLTVSSTPPKYWREKESAHANYQFMRDYRYAVRSDGFLFLCQQNKVYLLDLSQLTKNSQNIPVVLSNLSSRVRALRLAGNQLIVALQHSVEIYDAKTLTFQRMIQIQDVSNIVVDPLTQVIYYQVYNRLKKETSDGSIQTVLEEIPQHASLTILLAGYLIVRVPGQTLIYY